MQGSGAMVYGRDGKQAVRQISSRLLYFQGTRDGAVAALVLVALAQPLNLCLAVQPARPGQARVLLSPIHTLAHPFLLPWMWIRDAGVGPVGSPGKSL